jgi:hypothetical protein
MNFDLLIVFGRYASDFSYAAGDLAVLIERSGPLPRYVRTLQGERIEKILPEKDGTVVISPVEPVNLPRPLSGHLEIAFPAVVMPPRSERNLLLTFPLEIGVFLETGTDLHILDLFMTAPAKFSLYGSPAAGLITRWHRSALHTDVPSVDRLSFGVFTLTLKNLSSDTVEVARTVIDSENVHLFYGDYVSMAGVMEVFSPAIARTTVSSLPAAGGMEPCIELFKARKIPAVHGRGHLMEHGVA